MIGSVDLSPAHRATVDRILAEHVPDCEVRAFGSRVTWTATDYSDLDLAVADKEALPKETLARLQEAFEDSILPMRVDVLDWHSITEDFRKTIDRNYVIVQRRVNQAIAGEWRRVAIGEAIDFAIGGGWGKDTEFPDSVEVSVIRGTDFKRIADGDYASIPRRYEKASKVKRRTLKPGDVILEISGGSRTSNQSTGRSFLVSERHLNELGNRVIPASFCRLLRFDEHKVDPVFAYYSLQDMYLSGRAAFYEQQSTGISNFQFSYFRDSEIINLPSLAEQRAIAHILSTLDDKIELNRRMNQTLEEMARALFKSWFVDFDPVRAKIALKQHALGKLADPDAEPNRNSAPPTEEWTVERARAYLDAMDPQVVDLFPDRLVPSELGDIPEGWEVSELREFSDLNPESWTRRDSPQEVEYVDLANTKWGVIETTQHFPWNDAPSRAKRVLRSGDTIVGTVRPGNGSYSLVGSGGLTGSTGFAVLRPSQSLFRELIYLAATAPKNIERLTQRADGAAYPAVRPEVVADTKVAVPATPDDEVLWFSAVVGPMLDRMESNKTEMHSFAEQRDVLLPKLISGVTRMKSAE